MLWEGLKPPKPKSLDPLRPAEAELLKALRGEESKAEIDDEGFIRISDKTADAVGEAESLRAELIRHLLLSRDSPAPLPERGLRIVGARIDGVLDLEGAELTSDLGLVRCAFDAAPVLYSARCRSLYFTGSSMPGLKADRLRCAGGLFLRDGFKAMGMVRLLGAEIGGDLDCDGATLDGGGGDALSADGARVKGACSCAAGSRRRERCACSGRRSEGT